MDGKQYISRLDALGGNAERMRPHVERRKDNPFIFRDSSVDPVNAGTIDKVNRLVSPRYLTMEQQSLLQADQRSPQECEAQFLEQSERMEKKLQQSILLLNHKQQMQHKMLLMQQQQIQQQRQVQLQHQHEPQQQRQVQLQHQHEPQQQHQVQLQHQHEPQQTQLMVQQRMLRQRSPERPRQDTNVENQAGQQKPEHNHAEEMQKTHRPESLDGISMQDLFTQCQSHLDVINACTDLQQTIKDEMKRQAKLDNIICQKLVAKAQRLQQQATFLEKAHAPGWVGPALLDLGSQVTQQAEVHHIYTATLIEQCVVIQHSLDGHHELMKSVLAEHCESKQKPVSLGEMRNKSINSVADKRGQMKVADDTRSMTFLQASNIFEGIRKPRMKLLSSLEYQQDQLNATIIHLDQVNAEIESISNNEDSESLMWRAQLLKKDLEIRKEFLEARKEQLESDVQFARMDLNDFELHTKESLLEVLNVFCQHKIRYDTTLRHSFQLLQAASMRDINYLRRLTKKNDLDANTEFDSGDIYEGFTSKINDPWACTSNISSQMISVTMPGQSEHDSVMFLKSTSPQISKKKNPYLSRNPQEQVDAKIPTIGQTYSIVLSSDSEMSDVQKSSMYSPELKSVKMPTVNSYNVGQFKNMSDFNFSRAEPSPSLTETNDTLTELSYMTDFGDVNRSTDWRAVSEKFNSFKEKTLQSADDDSKMIISRYVGDVNVCENQPLKERFHSGTEDMMVVTRGPKPRRTLGNFENSIESECSIHCLYPMTTVREATRQKDERRLTHLINKYASGGRGSRSTLGKNWNSSKPMPWCKSLVRDKDSRRKMNRSLKYCKLLTQNNIQNENSETKHPSIMEPLMAHFKGQNVNNSEILHGHVDCEEVTCNKQSPEQNASIKSDCSSSRVDESKQYTSSDGDLEQDVVYTRESATGEYTEGMVSLTESRTGGAREGLEDETSYNQPLSQIMNSCELLPGQESRNLNNCEPLKCQIVNAEIVAEREDEMDFEAIQVLCQDSQPRQVRVCAVRPIPSEVDREGPAQTVAKGLTSDGSEGSQSRRRSSCKYDNLKVYEITAGQFTICELGAESKSRSTLESNRMDYSNNKQSDYTNFNNQVFPNQDSLNNVDFASCKNRVYESRPYDEKTVRKSACEFKPSNKTADGSCKNVNSQTVQYHAAFCTDKLSCGEDVRTVSISGALSVPERRTHATKKIQDLPAIEFTKSEKESGHPNNLPNKDECNDKFDKDETLSKTLYHPEENDLKLHDSSECHQKLAEETGSISEQKTLHGCSCAKLVDNGEVTTTNRQLTGTVSKHITRNTTSQVTRTISSQRVCPTVANQKIDGKVVELLIENEVPRACEINTESKYEMNIANTSETVTSQTFSKSVTEMSSFTSKQASSQKDEPEEYAANETHSLNQHKQDYFRKLAYMESSHNSNICINSPQQEAQTRPLKSSLKKSGVNYTTGLESSKEEKEGSKYFPQCGHPLLAGTSQAVLHRETDKVHKCVKQVRFDRRVHYDDNTVTDTLDITTTSQESKSVVPDPENINTNCTDRDKSISGQHDQFLMYSSNTASSFSTSYFTKNCNASGTDETNQDFPSNTFSVT